MNANLQKTLVTTVLAFTAGAACAGSITMFSFKDTLSPEEEDRCAMTIALFSAHACV